MVHCMDYFSYISVAESMGPSSTI